MARVAALAVAAIATALLSACGGSDSGSTEPNSTQEAPVSKGEHNKTKPAKDSQARRAQSDGGHRGSGSGAVATPLRVSGGGSSQFREKGGDNSIQEYGEESDESELQKVAEIVRDFYVARAEEDWNRACSYLATSMVKQLEALASQSPQLRDKGCAPVLKAFTRQGLPASVRRETTVVDAGSFRHDDERGFLIYYDSEHKVFAIPLAEEDGEWKLTLLAATPLG
jgi:hypothetical protein